MAFFGTEGVTTIVPNLPPVRRPSVPSTSSGLLFPLVWKTGHNHAGGVGKQVNTYPVTGLDVEIYLGSSMSREEYP